MSYRDELKAAQARADAATRELEDEREAREENAERVAELEKKLFESTRELQRLRIQVATDAEARDEGIVIKDMASESAGIAFYVLGLGVAVLGIVFLLAS